MFQDSHNPAHLDGVSRIVLVDGVHQKAHEDVVHLGGVHAFEGQMEMLDDLAGHRRPQLLPFR